MKINTAIKILEEYNKNAVAPSRELREKAIELGIEALKLNKLMRETYAHPEILKLPGETEEGPCSKE